MKIENIWYFLIAFGVIAFFAFGQNKLRDNYLNKLTVALSNGDYDLFNKYANSIIAKFLFDQFSICYMKLNAAFLHDNKDEIDTTFKEFDYIDMSPKQKEDLYSKVFNYYMSSKYYDDAMGVLDKIEKNFKNSSFYHQSKMIYDIYALGSGEYIDELLKENEQTSTNQRGFIEMLISDSYKNIDDSVNASKYKNLSLKHFKSLENDIKKGKINVKSTKKQ